MQRIRRIGHYLFTGDRLLVTLFGLLLVYYGFETLTFFRTMSEDVVGPASFPRLLTVFGAILVVLFFLEKKGEAVDKAPPGDEPRGKRMVSEGFDLIPVFFMLVYVLVLEPLGFLLSTFLFIVASMRFLGATWKGSVVWSFALTIGVFVLFYYGLRAEIPMGTLVPTEDLLPFLVHLRRAMGA